MRAYIRFIKLVTEKGGEPEVIRDLFELETPPQVGDILTLKGTPFWVIACATELERVRRPVTMFVDAADRPKGSDLELFVGEDIETSDGQTLIVADWSDEWEKLP